MRTFALTAELLGYPLMLERHRAAFCRQLLHQGGDDLMLFGQPTERSDEPDLQVVDGVAVVPIRGVLMPGGGRGWSWSSVTFYGDIRAGVRAAMERADVRALVLHVDSPGGTVKECFDTAEQIYAARGTKPIVAICDEHAASAGYALACSADTVIVPKTGVVGSIGVVGMHVDVTDMLQQAGIKVTLVQFGARKTDSYPETQLSDEARARMQSEIDELGEMFVDLVARNRGISADAVRSTEAGVFMGQHGIENGLADAVMSSEAAFADLLSTLNR